MDRIKPVESGAMETVKNLNALGTRQDVISDILWQLEVLEF